MSSIGLPFVTPAQRLDSYFNSSQPRESFNDSDIEHVATLLKHCGHVGHRNPRTYIILRTIGELDILEPLLEKGFGDSWFPVQSRLLPSFLDADIKTKIIDSQRMILTSSLDLENGKHCHFSSDDQLPFVILTCLGSGGYGQVDKIESKISYKQYALKRIRRRTAFGNKSRQAMEEFRKEMEIMKTLKHRHTIEYIGSYTDLYNLGLVMTPVATCDLGTYMKEACNAPQNYHHLSSLFGCLASALAYLHSREVKHRDIKPQNILIDGSNVLIADFGLSRDFLDTTSGLTPASPRYCPPEVAAYEQRNMSADIWSLGCVFLEMTAALHGYNVEWVKTYYQGVHNRISNFHANPEATAQLLHEWEEAWEGSEKIPLSWIRRMLVMGRKDRPTADEVLEMILASGQPGYSPTMFCGGCCVSRDGNRL